MNLEKILEGIENSEDIIKQINSEIGKEYVPRFEFNSKLAELKDLHKQVGDLTTNYDAIANEKKSFETVKEELEAKVAGYEKAALKTKIAHEMGIPIDLASRLNGDNENDIRSDAENFRGHLTPKISQPLKSTEPKGLGKDSAYKALLNNLQGE